MFRVARGHPHLGGMLAKVLGPVIALQALIHLDSLHGVDSHRAKAEGVNESLATACKANDDDFKGTLKSGYA
jgi:hypothetical protein